MDKETLSNYGWVVIVVIVLAIMIALATPFGNYIADGTKAILTKFSDDADIDVEFAEVENYTVLDSGECGDALTWELRSNGELRISGTGPMYDYVKYDAERQSPWYKYRDEPYVNDAGTMFLNPDGTEYVATTKYNEDNPNGWKIKNIVIEPGVTYIGNWAFYRICVDELTIPEGVTETGYFAVRFSPTLKTLNLPDSLILLDDFAVSRNQVLETINFGDSLETIGLAAFQNNNALTTAILPESVTAINQRQHATHDAISSETNELGVFEGCESLKNVSLGSVTYIPQRTFLNCSSLESIVIPNTVEYIEGYAFGNCSSLKTVEFEAGSQCKTIKAKAFIDATNIESITGCTALETVEELGFNNNGLTKCTTFDFSDTNIAFQSNMFGYSAITTATIGPNVSVIPNYMFKNSALEVIYISNSVTKFGDGSLRECSSLKDIYYDGTKEQWSAITKGNNWAYLTPNSTYSTVVHFSDGTTDTLKNVK